MDSAFLLGTLALVPYFTSRAFVPLFATALVARFGAEWTLLSELLSIELLETAPAWALSDEVLVVVGCLAAAEVVATKSQSMRELLAATDAEVKAILAAGLVAVLAAGELSGQPLDGQIPVATAGLDLATVSPVYLWAGVVGLATWGLASLRRSIYLFLMEIDADDDLGLQGLLAWLEDGIGFLGVLFALVLPSLALVVAALTLAALATARWLIRRREEAQKVPCPACQAPAVRCGVQCGSCGGALPAPRDVGLLGTIRERPAAEPPVHAFRLRAERRCRSCGERLRSRDLDQRCGRCGLPAFDSARDLDAYLGHLRATLPRTMLVLFLCGMVPVLGLVPGIIYYRLTLVASLRCYLPRGSRFVGRWGVRLLHLVLILLQPVPVIGSFMLPLMALSSYGIYSRLVRRRAGQALAAAPVPA